MISSIRHVGIVVRDLERSLDFWAGALGLSIYMRRIEEGPFIDALTGLRDAKLEWVKLVIPKGGLVELLHYHSHPDPSAPAVQAPIGANAIGCSHVALTVDDLSTLHAEFVRRGYTSKSEPLISPNGKAKILYCHDPDGVIVELIEDLPAPAEV
jgi:catechol 2,3-dioxygenase-like lactoylglutathione lyase family enzyme